MIEIEQLALFFLVLVRISAFFVTGPVLSMPNIPAMVKIGLAFLITIITYPLVEAGAGGFQVGGLDYIFVVSREALVGLAMGYVASLLFNALLFAGGIIDMHIGFFMSSMFDPMSGAMTGIVSRFLYLMGMAVLLGFNGHHMMISALVRSYSAVPVNVAAIDGNTAMFLIKAFAQMITIGVQIAAPLIAVALIIDVTLGLLARTAPQINVFMLGFPIKVICGLATLGVMVPVLVRIIYSFFGIIERDILTLLKGLA